MTTSHTALARLELPGHQPHVVMRGLHDQLKGMAAQIPEPALATPLGFFGDLALWSANAHGAGARAAERASALEALTERARDRAADLSPGATLGDVMESLGRDGATGDADAQRTLVELIEELQAVEHGDAGASAPRAASPDGGPPDVDAVTAYLRERFGADASARTVTLISGGYSKTTLVVDAVLDGAPQEVVVRQVPDGAPVESLAPEFGVLESVWSPQLPIPEPLWLESERNSLGGPFFVSRRSPGVPIGDVEGAGGASVPPSLCADIARFLAALHAADASSIVETPVLPMRTAAEITAAIDDLVARMERNAGGADPQLRAIVGWLRANVPGGERVSVVHGDIGFQNMLAADGRLTAVLDWERAHIGDAAEDLAYLRPAIEPVADWDGFLAHYASAGGRVPEPDTLRFYTVWQDAWRYVECARLALEYYDSSRIASAIAGFVYGPRFRASAVRTAFGIGAADVQGALA